MDETAIDRIFENLFHALPLLHKKLLRMDLEGVTGDLTRLHIAIMAVLSHSSLPASELGRLLSMQKPQVTHLVEQLVNLGIVERSLDARDRRLIIVSLTDHGKVLLEEGKKKVLKNIRDKLVCLTPDELTRMSSALETLTEIGAKL